MSGRNFRALFGCLIIIGDGYIVFTQLRSSVHFEFNDLIFHIVVFVGGLLLIDYKVGREVLTKVSHRVSRKFRKVDS